MKTFLDDLRRELMQKNLRSDEIDDIVADHRDMITSAIEEGMSEADIIKTFGEPKQIAEDIASDSESHPKHEEENSVYRELLAASPDTDEIEINVDLIGDAVSYRLGADRDIKVLVKNIRNIDKYQIGFKNGVLKIRAPKISGLMFMSRRHGGAFEIHIPKNTNIKLITQHGVNAEVNMAGINTDAFDLNTTNGDVRLADCALGFVSMNSVNADITIDHFSAKEVKLSQVSGDTVLKDGSIRIMLKFNTVSGDVRLENVKADVTHFHSVSGDVIATEFYPEALSFSSVSGDLKLTNQAEHKIIRFKTHTLSGTIST